jgi:protein-L-isoaspartate O-methyltransferase
MNRADFIPDVIYTHRADGLAVPVDRHSDPDRWRELVDAEHWVITQIEDGKAAPGKGQVPTSSSSAPAVMARMTSLLDPLPGMNVLEIGAGTGYNAALIAQAVSPGHVTTIEIDPGIADHARAALGRTDLPVTVITADGTLGHADSAPYDRVMCTASALCVPYAWVEQTRPGGVIVLPLEGSFSRQAFARLTVDDDGTATGRFHGGASFMRLRTQRDHEPLWQIVSLKQIAETEPESGGIPSSTAPAPPLEPFTDFQAAFALGLLLPEWIASRRPRDGAVLLSDQASSSWASVFPTDNGHTAYHEGPHRLWEDLEAAYRWWLDAGRPDHTRFGLTVGPDGQTFWLDSPDNLLPPIGETTAPGRVNG